MLQLDVGTCLETGNDPVAWVEKNPGRIRSMHCKDWSPEKQYRMLLGEGVAPWKKLLAAAESKGGIEYYLIEQEGSDYSEMETAERCLAAYRKLHNCKMNLSADRRNPWVPPNQIVFAFRKVLLIFGIAPGI